MSLEIWLNINVTNDRYRSEALSDCMSQSDRATTQIKCHSCDNSPNKPPRKHKLLGYRNLNWLHILNDKNPNSSDSCHFPRMTGCIPCRLEGWSDDTNEMAPVVFTNLSITYNWQDLFPVLLLSIRIRLPSTAAIAMSQSKEIATFIEICTKVPQISGYFDIPHITWHRSCDTTHHMT